MNVLVGILSGVLALTAWSPAALAAEPASPVERPAWARPYVGLHAGYGWGRTDWAYSNGKTVDHYTRGAVGGGQVGYGFETGSFVLGLEADADFSDIEGEKRCPSSRYKCRSDIDGLASLRARIGTTAGNTLYYATIGSAVGRVKIETIRSANGTVAGSEKTRFGWVVGFGVEQALTSRWSVKAEFSHYDLGRAHYLVDTDNLIAADVVGEVFKIGVNYRFGAQ